MTYEFLAVRYLQRYFGGTLDVWSSEIAVCMAGLALGYGLGGKLADRLGSWRLLGKVLVIGGATGCVMESLANWLGNWFLDMPPASWQPLVAALGCSFLPLAALGTVPPQAVRLRVRRLEKVGAAVGWVSAISTSGSIFGVLMTGMVLMERYGMRSILWGLSLGLMISGILLAGGARVLERKGKGIALLAIALVGVTGTARADRVLFEKYTAFNHVLVVDQNADRILFFDGMAQTSMSLADPLKGGFEYTNFFHAAMVLNPAIHRTLFLGLGGATGPKEFLHDYPGVRTIDIVEVDPVIVDVARRFFHLPDNPRIHLHVADGRVFLRRSKERYDAIFQDTYCVGRYGAYIPYHLATLEFFRIVYDHLNNGGVLVFNAIGRYGKDLTALLESFYVTLSRVFDTVYVFEVASSYNTMFVAMRLDSPGTPPWPDGPWTHHPLDKDGFTRLIRKLDAMKQLPASLPVPTLLQRLRQFSRLNGTRPSGKPLTDDFAPVDISTRRRLGR